MFPDDILNLTKIDAIYDDLSFKANESLPELFLKLTSHYHKLRNKPREHWIRKLDAIVSEIKLRYHADTNILRESELYIFSNSTYKVSSDVPAILTIYPFFHPNRSRFLNMATLYTKVLYHVTAGLLGALPNKDHVRYLNTDFSGIADKSYVRWEENGGVELQLPSFKLTNRQMLWLSIKHVSSFKSHKKKFLNSDEDDAFLQLNPAFREAFKCGDTTAIEKAALKEYDTRIFFSYFTSYYKYE